MKHPIHVMPEFDGERKHEESTHCWCEPEWVNEQEVYEKREDVRVYVHRRPE